LSNLQFKAATFQKNVAPPLHIQEKSWGTAIANLQIRFPHFTTGFGFGSVGIQNYLLQQSQIRK
jgi:hypothetical protein